MKPDDKLPEVFVAQMKKQLGAEYPDYLACLSRPMYHALRLNTLKISGEEFLKISPFHSLEPVPWSDHGFYYDPGTDTPSRHPYYYAGLYYLQEPSAMLPAAVLPVHPGDRVLDLCAAPGGKSTELAAKLSGQGVLVANDVSASRSKALIKNLEVFGAENILVTCETPERLAEYFPGWFDKILIDAPCSGEGMFRKSDAMIEAFRENGIEKYAALQREILHWAVKMLAPGGMLLYSTCTFAPEEDEDQAAFLLEEDPDLVLADIPLCPGFEPGRPEWCTGEKGPASLRKTVHVFPHRVKGEGHFAALFQDIREKKKESMIHISSREVPVPEEAADFLKNVRRKKTGRLVRNGDRIFLQPEGLPDLTGLRVLRNGLFLGTCRKKRFEPAEALAMVLGENEFSQSLNLSLEDPRVIRYLRGESLETEEKDPPLEKGYCLILTDGYPLGFGKVQNGRIKNMYLPGWRMQ